MAKPLKSIVFILVFLASTYSQAFAQSVHGLAMYGQPAMDEDFDHLPYVNPAAPQGGEIRFGFHGTFNSMNPFIVKGTAPRGLWDQDIGNNVFEPLLARSADEPFTMYGMLAETVEMAEDRSWIQFNLNPLARFSDGKPVTATDLLFTIELLKAKGNPNFGRRLKKIETIKQIGTHGVKLSFGNGDNRELPLLLGFLPVLPAHYYDPETFDQSSLTPPMGSGPYVVGEIDPGTSFQLKRNPDYWARDLPVRRGFNNFDSIRIEYFKDENARLEGFKKGLFDLLTVGDPSKWATAFDFPAVTEGKVEKAVFKSGAPSGMRAIAFNTRRSVLANRNVRKALTYLFDFEWTNRNLYFGAFERTASYFHGSALSAYQRPISDAERMLLGDDIGEIPAEILDGSYRPPRSDGSGRDRKLLREAVKLLTTEGFKQVDGKLHGPDGQPMELNMMVRSRDQERLGLVLQQNFGLLGITLNIRSVDATQYWDRILRNEFDMLQTFWSASLSPGNEQYGRWSSSVADSQGYHNHVGARSNAIDRAIDHIVGARDPEELVMAVRAYDRLLMGGYYVIPLYHASGTQVAVWNTLRRPDKTPLYGYRTDTWWAAPQ